MQKNVAGQKIGAQMVSATDGSAFTGSVTVYVTGDAGTQAAGSVGSGACTHEGNGYHTYAPAQAETNYDLIAFTFIGTSAVPATVQVFTGYPQTGDAYARLGAPAGASVSADVAAVKAQTAAIETDTQDLQTQVGTDGAGLTNIPWNAAWDAEVQSEATDALNAYDPPTNTEMAAAFTEIKGATWSSATDTLEHIRNKQTDIETDTQDLQTQIGTDGAGLTAIGDTRLANLDATVSSRAAAGDEMDLVNAPNATAITAIQAGLATPTNITAGTITTVTNLTNLPAAAATAAELAKVPKSDGSVSWNATALAAINAEVDTALNTAIPGSPTADSINERIVAIDAYGTPPTAAAIRSEMDSNSTKLANLDAAVSSRLATAGYTAPLDAAGTRTAVGLATNNLDTQLAALPTDADVQTAAAAALTAYDPPTKAELDSGFAGLNDPTAAAVADAVWDEAIGGHTSAGSTSKALIDVLDDTSTSLPLAIASITPQSAADIRAEMDANSTKLAAIVADTNELQTNQGNWLTADVSALATAAALATVDGIVDDILVDTGTTLPGTLATIAGYVDTEVAAILAAVDTEVAAIKAKTDNLPAAPAATGDIPTAAAVADAVWDEAIAGHAGVGSTGEALTAAGSAGDPWATALPGAYGSGTAGKIIGDNINATVSSRASQTSVDDLPTNAELASALASADDATLAAIGALNNLSSAQAQTAAAAALTAYDPPTKAELDNGLAALNDLDATAVQAAAAAALAAYDPPTNAEMVARTLLAASYFDPATDTVARVTLVDTTTTNTDMVAAAPSAATVADAVWDEALSGHAAAGSTGAALTAASAAGDPWSTALPGAYGAGTAGKLLSDIEAVAPDNKPTIAATGEASANVTLWAGDAVGDAPVSAVGNGAISFPVTVNDEDSNPIDGVEVWITTDSGGTNVVAGTLSTDALGVATFMLDAGDYYVWRQQSGYNFTNPVAITVS